MNSTLQHQIVMFIVMVFVGICFNPMNGLAHTFDDIYMSYTLFYGGLLMASNMIWAHEIVHYITMNHFNLYWFVIGIILSVLVVVFFS